MKVCTYTYMHACKSKLFLKVCFIQALILNGFSSAKQIKHDLVVKRVEHFVCMLLIDTTIYL